jgi:hypothetical protein
VRFTVGRLDNFRIQSQPRIDGVLDNVSAAVAESKAVISSRADNLLISERDDRLARG